MRHRSGGLLGLVRLDLFEQFDLLVGQPIKDGMPPSRRPQDVDGEWARRFAATLPADDLAGIGEADASFACQIRG